MRGPDFEIPADPPAPPADGPVPERPKGPRGRRFGVAALAAAVAFSGAGAFAWYSSQSTSSTPVLQAEPLPSTTQSTQRPRPSTSARPTPTTRATTVTRTCVDSAENPAAAGGATPEGFPWITFHVRPRVTRDSLVRIAEAAAQARAAYGDAGALGVRVFCEVQEMADAYGMPADELQRRVTGGQTASMWRGDIWIYGPNFEVRPLSGQRQAIYHEYFHALQSTLSHTRSARGSDDPLWLIEGSAEYFEHAMTSQELDSFRRREIRRREQLPALEELEQSGGATFTGGTGHAYTVGVVAADYLVTTYGRERLQTDYWVALAESGWRSAFLQVFGISVDTFYADFAAYRQTLRP